MIDEERELPMALRAAYLALHRRTNARFSQYGVTADQFVLLAALSETQAVTQRQLAERISSDPSTVRAMLVLLEARGYVKRESHPTDLRAKTVSLSSAGKRILNKLWKAGQPIRDQMVESMTSAETGELISLLQRLAVVLNQEQSLSLAAVQR